MTNQITKANASELVPALTYGQHYIENLRTGACRMVALVSGVGAAKALETSTEPKRLFFVLEPEVCEWFALCDRQAITAVDHPVLGDVICCQRCADFANGK